MRSVEGRLDTFDFAADIVLTPATVEIVTLYA